MRIYALRNHPGVRTVIIGLTTAVLSLLGPGIAQGVDGLSGPAAGDRPVTANPHANATARHILEQLAQLSEPTESRFLVGQNIGHAGENLIGGFQRFMERLEDETGQVPALLGVDCGFDRVAYLSEPALDVLQDHWKRGGLITLSMHPANPWRHTEARDTRTGDVEILLTPGTAAHARWMGDLDRTARILTRLRDAGVVVLWRPFHEMNGGWFWWAAQGKKEWTSQADFVRLWQQMFHYFTHVKKLDNLLWVYAPHTRDEEWHKDVLHYYPGDQFVDVVGIDYYRDDGEGLAAYQNYEQLLTLAKPMGLTEFGPLNQRHGEFDSRKILQLTQRYPRIGFVMFWHSWPSAKVALVDQQHAATLLRDDRVLSRDKRSTLHEKPPTGIRKD